MTSFLFHCSSFLDFSVELRKHCKSTLMKSCFSCLRLQVEPSLSKSYCKHFTLAWGSIKPVSHLKWSASLFTLQKSQLHKKPSLLRKRIETYLGIGWGSTAHSVYPDRSQGCEREKERKKEREKNKSIQGRVAEWVPRRVLRSMHAVFIKGHLQTAQLSWSMPI